MKKYLKVAFILLACSNLLMADLVFNLGAQQFSNSVKGNFQDSTYDLPNSVVSTALKFDKGHYIPYGSGSFKVELKKFFPKWAVTFDIDAYLYQRGTGLSLLGKDGKVLTLFFSYQRISVDGEVSSDSDFLQGEKIIGSIYSDGKVITVVINGKHNFKIEKANFKLAFVEANLGTDSSVPDQLNGLAISISSN